MAQITLREQIKIKRSKLTQTERQQAATQVTIVLKKSHFYQAAQHIAFYIAHKGELNPHLLLTHALASNKDCYLPALHTIKHNQLSFLHYQENDPLTVNRYGIHEPTFTQEKLHPASLLDLVLVPLLAFDTAGNRLGMGAGYYDRTFEFINTMPRPLRPKLVGLAYDFQRQKRLSLEPWDVTLDAIVTEKQIYTTSP